MDNNDINNDIKDELEEIHESETDGSTEKPTETDVADTVDLSGRIEALNAEIEELQSRLAEEIVEKNRLSAKLKDINTVYVRLQSDFDNYRKRTTEQIKTTKSEGVSDVIAKTVPILDVINQALQMITDEKVVEGVQMINRQLLDVLAGFGVTEIPALGKPFDPELHNAILQVQVDNPDLDGQVIEVFQKGYRMGDKIIRHSVVKVARG